jgi:hypothetical protein
MNDETSELIRAGASNWANWHDSQLTALGLRCTRTESTWRCWEPGGIIYLGAITLKPGDSYSLYSEIEALTKTRKPDGLIIADCWMNLDLSRLGFEAVDVEPWYISPPIPLPHTTPADLRIEQVSTLSGLREFEAASLKGFGVPDSAISTPFQVHAESSIEDPRLHYFIGRVDGEVASVSMAYVSDGIVSVYGVATLPDYRHRRYAEAMTRAAVQSGLGLPALLQPTPMAESLYQRMGFYEIGRLQMWRFPTG